MIWRRCFTVVLTVCSSFVAAIPSWAQGYVDTGDRIDGIAVISELEVDALAAGRYQFYFQAGWRSTGEKRIRRRQKTPLDCSSAR